MVKANIISRKINKKNFKDAETAGKSYNRIVQKLLSVGMSTSLMLAMVPNNGAFADDPEFSYAAVKPNHWGCSDLRSYLNGVWKWGNTHPLDTTNHDQKTSDYYESQFSAAEYGLVQPFTYQTNVLNSSEEADAVYKTTDKFWLPSGKGRIVSWGSEDISANAQYSKSTLNDIARMIPIPYWSYGVTPVSWLRSPYYSSGNYALGVYRGYSAGRHSVAESYALAAAFKINLSSVIFASAASAASITSEGGAKKIQITGSDKFGENKFSGSLPDYGMYLKTRSNSDFRATSVNLSGTDLTVNFTGGETGQYVVVQGIEPDSFTDGSTTYVAAAPLRSGEKSVTIDVQNWGIQSINNLAAVVAWMEDGSGSLAQATEPVVLLGTAENYRVFAMKEDLQCSWGKLNSATDLAGTNPTNQKIYFGKDNNGAPLQFWIAGRETAATNGEVSDSGDIMTLYQAKSVETIPFNASSWNYDDGPLNELTTEVQIMGKTQKIKVRGSYDVLPQGTRLIATVVPDSPNLDPQTFVTEHKFNYDIKLVDANGKPLDMPLRKKVQLLFQVIDGLDAEDLEIVLARIGEDVQFEESLCDIDGDRYVGALTDHFSPYSLIDKLNDEEKAALNAAKTGDELTYFTVSGLGLIMTLALGLMLKTKINKKKYDE